MDKINEIDRKELIEILEDLVKTITTMQTYNKSILLDLNAQESKDWLAYLKNHTEKAELRALVKEISERFEYRFGDEVESSDLDTKRVRLMEKFLVKSSEVLGLSPSLTECYRDNKDGSIFNNDHSYWG